MEKEPYIDRLKVFLESSLKKETPEEYKARKESQAQRKVKKETPEEYAARIEYIKKKEEVELKLETQRLFEKAEKQHQNHLNYLSRQNEKAEREEAREKIRIKNEAYNNTEEGREHQARKNEDKAERDKLKAYNAEKHRIWNTDEARRERRVQALESDQILYQQSIQPGQRPSGGGSRYGRGSGSSSGMGCGGSRVYEPRTGGGPANVEGN